MRNRARDTARAARDRARTYVGPDPTLLGDPDARLIEIMNGQDKNHRYDLQTAVIIDRVLGPADFAIDVGCHEGAILDHMIKAAPDVRHLAFEPLPHLHRALIANYVNTDIHRVALVAEPDGDLEFHHVVSNPGYSGLKQRRYDRPNETVEVISVPTAKLDDLVRADQEPKLIKIDVEGAELGVLQGASKTIARCQPIVVFEHGLGGSDIYGTDPSDISAFFATHGMDVSLLGSWLDGGPALTAAQFSEQFHQGINYYFIAHPATSGVDGHTA